MTTSRLTTPQAFIKNPLKDLGFNPNMEGICNGYTMSFIENAVIGEKQKFYDRIQLIKNTPIAEKINTFITSYENRILTADFHKSHRQKT